MTVIGALSALAHLGGPSAAAFPLLPLQNASAPWAKPNPRLPFPVGPNPGLVFEAAAESPPAVHQHHRRLQPPAPISKQGLLLGDVRIRLHVTASVAQHSRITTAQIFWRRRDHTPQIKAVVVTDAAGAQVQSSVSALQSGCGVVHFSHTGPGDYFVYYLPHHQTGGGAGVHFTWFNCSDPTHGRKCVLEGAAAQQQRPTADACATVDAAASSLALAYENRPNSYGEHDHTPSGEPFHGFTKMELTALPSELQHVRKGMAVFMEPREHAIRMFDQIPAHWARAPGGEVPQLGATATIGEFFTFQAGVFANGPKALRNLSASFSPLVLQSGNGNGNGNGAAPIPSSAMTCFNLGGNDQHGQRFTKNFTVGAGRVGALWFGIDLPGETSVGVYKGTITLSAAGGGPTQVLRLTLTIAGPSSGQPPIALHGDADVYAMRRLRWLDSTIGVDETVTHPFTNLTVTQVGSTSGFSLGLVNKRTQIGANGLPVQSTVTARKVRRGSNTSVAYEILAAPVTFQCRVAGKLVQMEVTQHAKLLTHTSATATWHSLLEGGGLELNVSGLMDFDSYMEFSVTVRATQAAVELSDIVLEVQAGNSTAKMMCGFGVDGQYMSDLNWTWNQAHGNNRFWMGRVEAGVFVYPRGAGPDWENPNCE
jgi:hypothetical protein